MYDGQAAMELAIGTYGFCNPRESLYDAFVKWEGADGYRLSKTMMNYDQLTAYGVAVQPGAAVYGNEGFFFWKNQSLKSDVITDMSYFQGGQFINLKMMRYAEVRTVHQPEDDALCRGAIDGCRGQPSGRQQCQGPSVYQ